MAAGIEINDKIYVLDQQLPILSLDNWQKKMNTKAVIYKRKIDKRSKMKQIDIVFDRIALCIRIKSCFLVFIELIKLKN